MTKEEAITILSNATFSDEWQGNEDLTTAYLMAIEALEQEPSRATGKWIPVSERLPEVGSYILATRSKPEEPKVIVMQYCEHIWATGNLSELITAWQPLPDPYKGGEEK